MRCSSASSIPTSAGRSSSTRGSMIRSPTGPSGTSTARRAPGWRSRKLSASTLAGATNRREATVQATKSAGTGRRLLRGDRHGLLHRAPGAGVREATTTPAATMAAPPTMTAGVSVSPRMTAASSAADTGSM